MEYFIGIIVHCNDILSYRSLRVITVLELNKEHLTDVKLAVLLLFI